MLTLKTTTSPKVTKFKLGNFEFQSPTSKACRRKLIQTRLSDLLLPKINEYVFGAILVHFMNIVETENSGMIPIRYNFKYLFLDIKLQIKFYWSNLRYVVK